MKFYFSIDYLEGIFLVLENVRRKIIQIDDILFCVTQNLRTRNNTITDKVVSILNITINISLGVYLLNTLLFFKVFLGPGRYRVASKTTFLRCHRIYYM